jgi:hypothetical protein
VVFQFYAERFVFQVLIGNERQDCPLPVSFTEEEYEQLTDAAKQLNLEVNLVHQCYQRDGSNYLLVKDRYRYLNPGVLVYSVQYPFFLFSSIK